MFSHLPSCDCRSSRTRTPAAGRPIETSRMCVVIPLTELVMMEIENVAVQILYGKLPHSPRLCFKRFDDVRTPRSQFLVRRIDIISEYPVDRWFERQLPLPEEYRYITA